MLAADDVRTVSGAMPAGGTATVVYSREKNAGVLVMNNVPPPSSGTVYQMWLMGDNGAKLAGTVNNFASLSQKGYFDDTPCHRLTESPTLSVLQCGDPTGQGSGGPGYRFDNEYPTNQYPPDDPALQQPVRYLRGTLAMANAGPGTNGSQFFLVYKDSVAAGVHSLRHHRPDRSGNSGQDRRGRRSRRGRGWHPCETGHYQIGSARLRLLWQRRAVSARFIA